MKVCKGCALCLPLDLFYTNRLMANGRLSYCKDCIRVRYRAGRSARSKMQRSYIQAIKTSRGCADCGYNANPVALDFDHLDASEKRCQLSVMAEMSLAAIDAEIAKCEVVCANCHRIRTHERRIANAQKQNRSG